MIKKIYKKPNETIKVRHLSLKIQSSYQPIGVRKKDGSLIHIQVE